MRDTVLPLPSGPTITVKVFTKLYNAFYCSKKNQGTSSPTAAGDVRSSIEETELDHSTTIAQVTNERQERRGRRKQRLSPQCKQKAEFQETSFGEHTVAVIDTHTADAPVCTSDDIISRISNDSGAIVSESSPKTLTPGEHYSKQVLGGGKSYDQRLSNLEEDLENVHVTVDDFEDSSRVRERQQRIRLSWFKAVQGGNASRLEEMIGMLDVNSLDSHGWAALHTAAWNGHQDICQLLINQTDCTIDLPGPGGSTALLLASQSGHTHIASMLLAARSDPQHTAILGRNLNVSALHMAAQNGHVEIVELLIKAGAKVNASMTSNEIQDVTPLHLAVQAGHLDVMDILIAAGCNVHKSTKASSETIC